MIKAWGQTTRLLATRVSTLLLLISPIISDACATYITYQEGNIPVLLTAPHGAGKTKLLPHVAPRQGKNVKYFVNRADQYTDEVTHNIAQRLGRKELIPFVLIAGISRSQIDFNRPAEQAYEDKQAKECYNYYHKKIRQAITTIKQKWPNGFMIDIHGQSKHGYEILRGTRNKKTITQLTQRFNGDVSEQHDGFFSVLREKNYQVHPEKNKRELYYYGGFTVKQYGSHLPSGIDAIQIEINRNIRTNESFREKAAIDIAEAVERFYRRYYTNQ